MAVDGYHASIVPRGLLLSGASLALILVVTLWPTAATNAEGLDAFCLLCGSRGTADAILNVLLFVPLGVGVGRLWGVGPWSAGAVVLLTAGIEALQAIVPGRHPTLADVLFNSAGGWLGIVAASRLARPAGRVRPWTAAGTSLLATSVLLAPGLALRASFPESVYYGQWTPDLGHLERYDGRVVGATLGALSLAPGRHPVSAPVRSLLRSEAPLTVTFRAGAPPPGLAPIVSVYDDRQREIVLLGLDGDDVVFRTRLVADALRLDRPEIRWRGAGAGLVPGESVELTVRRDSDGAGWCLSVQRRETCQLGHPTTRGWSLLLHPARLSPTAQTLVDALWLASIFGLVAWFRASGGLGWLLVAFPFLAVVVAPLVSAGAPARAWHLGIAALSVACTAAARVLVDVGRARRSASAPYSP